ncbi:hypothetical protein HanPI659440_Chr06g0233481 [Helianthus annuus]|nr:hypothetical protein HanPI659440_Chr06g0233481 [Helianthus annuus]
MAYGMSINTLRWHTRQFITQHHKITLSSPSKTFGRTPLDRPSYFSILFFTFQHHTSVKCHA